MQTDDMIIVGVNKFALEEPPPANLLRVKAEVEVAQKKSLAGMKAKRDGAKVQQTLKALEAAAKGTENLMPHILTAVNAYATLGEISDVFRGVFGVHRETVVL